MTITKPILLDETGVQIKETLEQIRDAIQGGETNHIYGIRRSLSSTSSAWIRTDDAMNLTAQASIAGASYVNNFDYIYPWSDIVTVNYDVANDTVSAKIGDANFAFDGTNGEVMTYIPKFYYKRWQDASNEYIQIAKYYFDGAKKSDEFYIGRYTTSANTHSISGVQSTVNQNITTFRTQARAKGQKWQQLDWHYFIIQMLYLVEYADGNSQTKLGNGVMSETAQVNTGGCDSLNMTSGCVTNDSKHSVIYRGIENPYGNIWQFVDGLNINDYQAYICYDASQYDVNKFTEPYQSLGYINANTSGSPNQMGYDSNNSMAMLPKVVGTSTYGDYYYCSLGNRIAVVGGTWSSGANVGFFSWHLNLGSGVSGADIGGRLLKTV